MFLLHGGNKEEKSHADKFTPQSAASNNLQNIPCSACCIVVRVLQCVALESCMHLAGPL